MRKACIVLLWLLFAGTFCFGQQIDRLPQDSGKWHLSVIGDATDPAYQQLVTWFHDNAGLKRIKATSHWHAVPTGSPSYDVYRPSVKELPCVLLQSPDGTKVFESCGKNLPHTAADLLAKISDRLRQCPNGYCPLRPRKETPPKEAPPVDTAEQDDTQTDYAGPPDTGEQEQTTLPLALTIVTGLLGTFAGAGLGIYRNR